MTWSRVLLVTLIVGLAGAAQPSREWRTNGDNPAYTGDFVFTRIRYGDGGGWGRGGAWRHDYPRADRHLSRLLDELTAMSVELDGTNVFDLDDPRLFRFPIAYISEPGFWGMSDMQAERLREYVLKGGFLILDDFEGNQLDHALAQLARVLPECRPIPIDISHPIFHSFFEMETIDFPHPTVPVMTNYLALFEDNDPSGRMIAIINHNADIAEYWEWSDSGWLPVDLTNEAYKLGINYIVYAALH